MSDKIYVIDPLDETRRVEMTVEEYVDRGGNLTDLRDECMLARDYEAVDLIYAFVSD